MTITVLSQREAKERLKIGSPSVYKGLISIQDRKGLWKPPFDENRKDLYLGFEDIVNIGLLQSPKEEDVDKIIEFGKSFSKDDPLLIHCHAGISRSSAAAVIINYVRSKDLDWSIRQVFLNRPMVAPNPVMCYFADRKFRLKGKLYWEVDKAIFQQHGLAYHDVSLLQPQIWFNDYEAWWVKKYPLRRKKVG